MKKLLLVLVVVTLASFLLVGCLPGGTTPDDGDDGDDGVVEAVIAFDKEYTSASGVTFIACGDAVTVTLPTAAPEDYVVYVAVKDEYDCDEPCDPYDCYKALTPSLDRKVWTGTFSPSMGIGEGYCAEECEPVCIVALLKHPCCAGEEIALRVVTLDCEVPDIPTFTFACYDCNECASVCEPEGAYFTFTSVGLGDNCNPGTDSCADACSGVGDWSFTVGGVCDLCTLATGSGCPVEGTTLCGCLPWQTAAERTASVGGDTDKTYTITFKIADNVGNYDTETYEMTVDTDEIVDCVAVVD